MFLSVGAPQKQRRAHADGRIGHVERRPMMRANIKIKEIRHLPSNDAINEIPARTAEHHCKHERGKSVFFEKTQRVIEKEPENNEAKSNENVIPSLEKTERDARVLHVHNGKNRKHGNLGAKRKFCANKILR